MTRVEVLAPISGRVVPMAEVPDPVFSELMLGDGLAIEPADGLAVSPIAGKLVVFHSAGHAFAVEDATTGVSVLVHVGLETVALGGRPFTRLAEVDDVVEAGQAIVRFDLAAIRAAGLSTLSPIVLPQLDPSWTMSTTAADEVHAGRDVLLALDGGPGSTPS
jgi:PTS system glucose-specific IIA component